MNPSELFALTPEQKNRYLVQPDKIENLPVYEDDFERSTFLPDTSVRFWYNTQTEGYIAHWHENYEIIIPLEYNYTVRLSQQTYILEPGDIFFIPPGILHSIDPAPQGCRFYFLIQMDFMSRFPSYSYLSTLISMPLLISQSTCSQAYPGFIRSFMQMAEYYWSSSPVKELHIFGLLLSFLADYYDYCSGTASETAVTTDNDSRFSDILAYISTHSGEKLTLSDISEHFQISAYYFSHLFRKLTGQTFCSYLTDLRIRKARTLLADYSLSISSVSEAAGFSSVSSFNRAFLRITGCSPSEYRKLQHPIRKHINS